MLPLLRFRTEVARNFQDITLESGSSGFRGGVFRFTGEAYTLSLTQPVFRYDRWVQLHQAGTRIQQAAAEVDAATRILGFG